MMEAIDSLRALKNKYDDPSIQDPLRRLSVDQRSQDVEEWARNLYLAKRDRNDANATSLDMDRKVILNLIYDLVNLWNKVRADLGDEAAEQFEDKIVEIFEVRRIERILEFGLPMDRAQSLYAMKIPTWVKHGMHWFCEYHFDSTSPNCKYDYAQEQTEEEQEEWRELLSDYAGFPTMNKRLYQLLFSDKMGLRRRHPNTFGQWCKPQKAEFEDIRTQQVAQHPSASTEESPVPTTLDESTEQSRRRPREDGLYSPIIFDSGRIVAEEVLKVSGQAAVYRGSMRKQDGSRLRVAIKIFLHESGWTKCKSELRSLLRIPRHANVMEVMDFYETPRPAFIMRFIVGGDLFHHLKEHGKFEGRNATQLLIGIGNGLHHLHSHNIVHRDLKSPNILLEVRGGSFHPVLIDLGLGKIMEDEGKRFQTANLKGTLLWMAPEMILSNTWSTETDMYALGIIMWEVLTGEEPYGEREGTASQIMNFVAHQNGRPDESKLRVGVTPAQQELVKSLWSHDPSERPSAQDFISRLEN